MYNVIEHTQTTHGSSDIVFTGTKEECNQYVGNMCQQAIDYDDFDFFDMYSYTIEEEN